MLHLQTFGGLHLATDDGLAAPRLRPLRLGLLAAVAAAGERGISRERLAAYFWPDSDDEHGRHSLRQALYALRRELGVDVVRSAASLSIDAGVLTSDVAQFGKAIAAGDNAAAVELARGPFLDGFYLPGASTFERWVEEERARLQAATASALLALAVNARAAGDLDRAVAWWRRLTILDPLSGRFAMGYLSSLAARGDRAEALAFARAHEAVVQRELDTDPDPEVRALESALRSATPDPGPPSSLPPVGGAARAREAPGPASAPRESAGSVDPAARPARDRTGRRATRSLVIGSLLTLGTMTGAFAAYRWWRAPSATAPLLAVGMFREEGVPDSLRIGGVLTDMLATNLARVEGLPVLANSRLFEVMRPGQDTAASGYADAARRAGATELLEGRLLFGPRWGLALELRRVDLRTGIVKGAWRVAADDRYALIDSATSTIARGLRLETPRSSVSEATTASPIAYRLYEEGLRAYYQYDHAAARRLMEAALAEDSTFAMAAYYASLALADSRQDDFRRQALRLAGRAPERERLEITASILTAIMDPASVAVAETLATKYPGNPRAIATLARARHSEGDWAGAVSAFERAIAIDSATEPVGRETCHVCEDFSSLQNTYHWWDSLHAAERVAQRLRRLRPNEFGFLGILLTAAASIRGDSAALALFQQFSAWSHAPFAPELRARLLLLLERYEDAERDIRLVWTSGRQGDADYARWLLLIGLRNQGRLAEASTLVRTARLQGFPPPGTQPAPEAYSEAALAMDMGQPRAATSHFERHHGLVLSGAFPSLRARQLTWNRALLGTALAATNDTVAVRRLADTVEYWGRRSGFGRDRRLHHFLRGLVHAAAGRDEDAIREFRAAVYSWSLGYTRINYELARVLLRQGRPREAVAALQPALRGEIDAANLWITRTDLHEALAQSFAAAGETDSAAVHYRAVVRAWSRADPMFHGRRQRAQRWLHEHSRPRRAGGIHPERAAAPGS
jgi:DNA-binding SARP family transcriptional activator